MKLSRMPIPWLPVKVPIGGGSVERMSLDRPSPRHSAGEGARDDFGDRGHFAIPSFPVGDESPSHGAGGISPSARCPNRGQQDNRRYLFQVVEVAHVGGLCTN